MDLALTDEQTMIRAAAADVLAERSASAEVRRALARSAGRDDALWTTLAGELGWNALALPEAVGGTGLGAVEQMLLMEQLGARLACVPYFPTTCLAATALAQCATPVASAWLSKLAEGACSATLALPLEPPFGRAVGAWPLPVSATAVGGGYALSGTIPYVIDGARADLLLVPSRIGSEGQSISLFAVDAAAASGLAAAPLDTLDATRPIARIVLDATRVRRDARLAAGRDAARVLERGAWFAALALAAEQVGGAQQCLDLTLAYTSQRVQFGRAIASFQVVKHRCAQMMVLIESARSAVFGAARAWDAAAGATPGAALYADIAAAKVAANEACAFGAQEAIQLHGGAGFTWEYDPHLFFKRAQASGAQFGATPQLLEWIARHAIDGGAPAREGATAASVATRARPSAHRAGARP